MIDPNVRSQPAGHTGNPQTTVSQQNAEPNSWEKVNCCARLALISLLEILAFGAGFAFGSGVVVLFGGGVILALTIAAVVGLAVSIFSGYMLCPVFFPRQAVAVPQ